MVNESTTRDSTRIVERDSDEKDEFAELVVEEGDPTDDKDRRSHIDDFVNSVRESTCDDDMIAFHKRERDSAVDEKVILESIGIS